jgi:hypothetical protein
MLRLGRSFRFALSRSQVRIIDRIFDKRGSRIFLDENRTAVRVNGVQKFLFGILIWRWSAFTAKAS